VGDWGRRKIKMAGLGGVVAWGASVASVVQSAKRSKLGRWRDWFASEKAGQLARALKAAGGARALGEETGAVTRSCFCVLPGCSNAMYVDVHHLVPRSEGGRMSSTI